MQSVYVRIHPLSPGGYRGKCLETADDVPDFRGLGAY